MQDYILQLADGRFLRKSVSGFEPEWVPVQSVFDAFVFNGRANAAAVQYSQSYQILTKSEAYEEYFKEAARSRMYGPYSHPSYD